MPFRNVGNLRNERLVIIAGIHEICSCLIHLACAQAALDLQHGFPAEEQANQSKKRDEKDGEAKEHDRLAKRRMVALTMKAPVPHAILLLLFLLFFNSCAHIVQTREDYALADSRPDHSGAELTAEMITTDGQVKYALSAMVYFAVGERETGPYKCLFTAWGDREQHRAMRVKNMRIRTAARSASVPPSGRLDFAPGAGGEGWQATYVIPGLVSVDYEKDGDVFIEADVQIITKRRGIWRPVTLRLTPTKSKETKFATIFDDFREGGDEDSANGFDP